MIMGTRFGRVLGPKKKSETVSHFFTETPDFGVLWKRVRAPNVSATWRHSHVSIRRGMYIVSSATTAQKLARVSSP